MADLVIKQHDTFPDLRGLARDQEGPLDLGLATKLKVILKHTNNEPIIEGEVEAIDPEEDPEGMNWRYKWATGDTAVPGLYNCELEITWSEGSTPQVQTVPNGSYAAVEIKADLA